MSVSNAVHETRIPGLQFLHRGKVRDLYALDDQHLLMVTTDRISAFDVVLPQPIPGKGEVLNRLSLFWFSRMGSWVKNHLSERTLADYVDDPYWVELLGVRAQVVRRLRPLPIEAIVRGYLIGSGWKDYQQTGAVCGIGLPAGLRLGDRLPEPIFTPSTKAEAGQHDENISFAQAAEKLGAERAHEVRDLALRIYQNAADYALSRGIIIADTKFEFGVDDQGQLHLIDEVLTPDSSRFWPLDQYQPGTNPPSFDKQYVRDYLETLDWNKKAPAPDLPEEVIHKTAEKYREAERILVA